jgi:SAM-dependent methyltransferase
VSRVRHQAGPDESSKSIYDAPPHALSCGPYWRDALGLECRPLRNHRRTAQSGIHGGGGARRDLARGSGCDVGCGTGNAALLAALRGARVTGVDPAARLLEVARVRAADSGVSAIFVQGDAASIPVETASADLVLSVFGVIFAPDAAAAAAEIARVTALEGRVVLTAWIPGGAINDCVGVFQKAVVAAIGLPPGPPPFAWHDQNALASLFGPHGFSVTIEPGKLAITATSAREYLEIQGRDHPMSVAGRALLESRGEGEAVAERALGILEAANETPGAFEVTSRYVMAIASRKQEVR